MAEIRTLKLNLLADVDQFTRGMKGAKGDIDSLGYKIGAFSKQAAKYFAVAAAAAGAFAIKIGIDSVKAAGNLVEAQSKVTAVFAEQAKEVLAWGNTTAKAFGVSNRQALEAAGTYGNLFRAFGIGNKEAVKMSKTLVELAADMASFNNVPIDQALNALRSGLSGETEPLKRFGVALQDVRLREEAVRLGLVKTTTEVLPPAIRAQAAYSLILQDTAIQQGDVSRTSEDLAAQMKFLSAGVEEAKSSFGEALLPITIKLVNYLNEKFIPMVQQISDGFAGKSGTEGLTGTALKVAKAMGYDEQSSGNNLGSALRNVAEAMGQLIRAIMSSDEEGAPSTLQRLANALETVAGAINAISDAVTKAKSIWGGSNFGIQFAPGGINAPRTGRALGGTVNAGQAVRVGEMGAEVFIPRTDGQIVPNNKLGGGGNTFIFNGVIDGESARRTIEKLLQDSARRSGAINLAGATL